MFDSKQVCIINEMIKSGISGSVVACFPLIIHLGDIIKSMPLACVFHFLQVLGFDDKLPSQSSLMPPREGSDQRQYAGRQCASNLPDSSHGYAVGCNVAH